MLTEDQRKTIEQTINAVGWEPTSKEGMRHVRLLRDSLRELLAASAAPACWTMVPNEIAPEMIEAAMCAHYGQRRVKAAGGAKGIAMTVNDIDYDGAASMRRIWKGALSAVPGVSAAPADVRDTRFTHPGCECCECPPGTCHAEPAEERDLAATIDNNIESLGNVATAADEKALPGLAKLLRKASDTLARCRALATAPAKPSTSNEPTVWAVYNGVSLHDIFQRESAARTHAKDMQKRHDLSGSLAAFHVEPRILAAAPTMSEAMLDVIEAAKRVIGSGVVRDGKFAASVFAINQLSIAIDRAAAKDGGE